jgi:hypothetical protein
MQLKGTCQWDGIFLKQKKDNFVSVFSNLHRSASPKDFYANDQVFLPYNHTKFLSNLKDVLKSFQQSNAKADILRAKEKLSEMTSQV